MCALVNSIQCVHNDDNLETSCCYISYFICCRPMVNFLHKWHKVVQVSGRKALSNFPGFSLLPNEPSLLDAVHELLVLKKTLNDPVSINITNISVKLKLLLHVDVAFAKCQ